jgi:hypothetical protein
LVAQQGNNRCESSLCVFENKRMDWDLIERFRGRGKASHSLKVLYVLGAPELAAIFLASSTCFKAAIYRR